MVTETAEEVARLKQGLVDSRANLQRVLAGLDVKASSVKPDSETWSILEIVEHLAIIEGRLSTMLETRLASTDVSPDAVASTPEQDRQRAEQVSSRIDKIKAPEAAAPSGRFSTCAEALQAFLEGRQKTIDALPNLQPFLRQRYLPHPFFGPLDGHTWLLILGAHTDRHVAQIEELKAALA